MSKRNRYLSLFFHVLFCSAKDNYLVTCYEEKVVKEKPGPKTKMRLNMNGQKMICRSTSLNQIRSINLKVFVS